MKIYLKALRGDFFIGRCKNIKKMIDKSEDMWYNKIKFFSET